MSSWSVASRSAVSSTVSRVGNHPGGSERRPVLRRATVGVALCLVMLLGAQGCGDDAQDMAAFHERGDEYFENEQYKEAIIEYRNVLRLDPNNAAAHYSLAKSYLKESKLREAYWELHETARLDPENVEARLTFGQLSLAARDFDEALVQADDIIEMAEDNGVAHLLRGQALEGLNRGVEAEASYLQAREASPEEPAHLLILASYYQRSERDEEAEPLLLELTKVEPTFNSYTAYGRFLARTSARDEETEAIFEKAVELAENDEQRRLAYTNKAAFLYTRERFDEAESLLEDAIENADDKLELIYLLARFHRAQGNAEQADQLILDATKAHPDDPRPHLVLSAYLGRKGDLEGALAAAERALEADPEDRRAKLRKAELLVDLGYRSEDKLQIAQGRGIVEGVLAKEQSDPSALFVRAKIEMAEGDNAAAVESLRAAIDGRPDWAQARYVLGSALVLTNDKPGARAELARALEIDPTFVEARRLLAQVHAALDEHEYAIEQGRLYLRQRPDHKPTRILVAQSLVRIGRGDEALGELDAIAADDRDADTLYALARLRASKGEFKEARQLLLQADAQRPNHPEILRNLLGVERKLGLEAESIARVEAAAVAKPDDARIAVMQGLVAMMAGDMPAAEAAYQRSVELDPNDMAGYEQLAYFYRVTGQLDKTINTYERALDSNPSSARLHHFLAVLYELNAKPDEAIEHYGEAIENDPRLGESMNNLAYLLAERGDDLDRALDLAQEAKALLPDSANAADTLGWVLFKRGIPQAAVGYLREAEAGMDPSDENIGVIRHHLALAYEASGENAKAIESLQRAVDTLEQQKKALTEAGRESREPGWAPDVRSMLERLQGATTG